MRRIIVVTDCTDVAAAEIRAALLRELGELGGACVNPGAWIEPFIFTTPMSLLNAGFLLRVLADSYAHRETVVMCVVNPLATARAERARLAGQTRSGLSFTSENTGALSWLIDDFGVATVVELPRSGLRGDNFIPFGGKRFYPHAAARLACGDPPEALGSPFDPLRLAPLARPVGTVVHIDNFGVAKFIGPVIGAPHASVVAVSVNGSPRLQAQVVRSMKDLPDGSWAVYPGSSLDGLPEFGRVRDPTGVRELSLRIGDTLTFSLADPSSA